MRKDRDRPHQSDTNKDLVRCNVRRGPGCDGNDCSEGRHIRNTFNPSFAGGHPEPLAQNLEELSFEVKDGRYNIGIATDGDADRVGAIDEKGNFVDSHRIFAILLKYLVERKHLKGEVAKSLSVSELIPGCARSMDSF